MYNKIASRYYNEINYEINYQFDMLRVHNCRVTLRWKVSDAR